MSKYAERYLSKSYGFIYVVNSANAGGVQKGRVRFLISRTPLEYAKRFSI